MLCASAFGISGPFESEYVLILSGDQLYQMDFMTMLENHKAKGADISIATIPVGDREAPEFGIMKNDVKGISLLLLKNQKRNYWVNGKVIPAQSCRARAEITWHPWGFIYLIASFCGFATE